MNSNTTSEINHCKTCKATFYAVIRSMKFCVGFFQVGNPHVSITPRVWTNAWWKIFIHSHFYPFSTVKEMKWNTILKLQLVVFETIEPQMIRNIHDLDNLKLFSIKNHLPTIRSMILGAIVMTSRMNIQCHAFKWHLTYMNVWYFIGFIYFSMR